jgi:hypothetical protein
MPLLTREQILQADDLPFEDVEVPEWGGTVRVRTLSGQERDAFEASITEQRGRNIRIRPENIRARLVALSVVDEEGQQLFDESDIRRLGAKSAKALDRLFSVAQRLSGISNEDVEELAKNSPDGQSDGSTFD